MKKPALITSIAILLLLIIFIFTNKKYYNYKKVGLVEYNRAYNEKYPIIDTIEPLYKNCNRIFIRKNLTVGGHEGIGSINGGSQVLFICNHDCKECNKK